MNLLLTPSADNRDLRTRLILLLGQSFTLGILLALLVITVNALFLSDFGSSTLPYVYLLVALLGSLVSYGSAKAQSVWTLPQVAMATITAVILYFIAAWLARTTSGARWVSFTLIAAFPLLLQIGFVILGGQAAATRRSPNQAVVSINCYRFRRRLYCRRTAHDLFYQPAQVHRKCDAGDGLGFTRHACSYFSSREAVFWCISIRSPNNAAPS